MDRGRATERLLQQVVRAKESAGAVERLLLQSHAALQRSPEAETFERFIGKHGENEGFDVDIARWLARELFGDAVVVRFIPVTPRAI